MIEHFDFCVHESDVTKLNPREDKHYILNIN